MPLPITRQKRDPLFIYDCMAFLVGALFAIPFILILTLPLIADF